MTLLLKAADGGHLRLGLGRIRFCSAHGNGLEEFAALLDDVEVVGGEGGELVRGAGGPADLDVGFGGTVEAEVDAEVVLREVAASGADLIDLDKRFRVGGF